MSSGARYSSSKKSEPQRASPVIELSPASSWNAAQRTKKPGQLK